MQKLLVELKNASEDAPQVPYSVSGKLNREETLSIVPSDCVKTTNLVNSLPPFLI
ncbi:hypothetical protein IPdc08_01781 [archaeon]|nr:hypothetical protein IPdc08_01781 [archaeon]